MKTPEVQRIAGELAGIGHTLSSFDQLGIADFEALAVDLRSVVAQNEQFSPEQAALRTGMVMCKDPLSKEAGRRMVRPVLAALFADKPAALEGWDMYTVNHYQTGDFYPSHQDYVNGTVVVITAEGERLIEVYDKELEDDVFRTVNTTYELRPGSILVLNGFMDIGHTATCTLGPSISVVGDVPELPSAA